MRRWPVVALVVALVATACTNGGSNETAPTTTIPEVRSLLRVAIDEWADCLNPVICDTPAARHTVFAHVLPRLIETDDNGEFVPSPVLTSAPQVSADELSITYRLDPDSRWSDGRPITSTDVRVTWQSIMATPGANRVGYELITSIDDRDPHVAVVRFRDVYGDWQRLFGGDGGWLVEADAIGDDLNLSGQFLTELPFSAGPFRLADWDPQSAVLVSNDDYWLADRVPKVGQVQLNNASFDGVLPDGVPVVAQSAGGVVTPVDGVVARSRPDTTLLALWLDQRSPLLGDLTIRQSISASIDRTALGALESAGDMAVPRCVGWIPGLGPWCDDDLPVLEAMPDMARFALATDGWVLGDDNVFTRNGVRLSLAITHDPTDARGKAVAELSAEYLRVAGFEIQVQTLPLDVWRTRPLDGLETGIGVYAIDLGLSPRVDDLFGCDRIGPEAGGANPIAWCNLQVDADARAFTVATRREEQIQIAHRIGDVVAAELVILPISQGAATLFILSDRVDAPETAPLGDGAFGRLYDVEVTNG